LINVPPDWNGGLIMFAHGYEGEGSGRGAVHSEPLADHLTERGYAWAASGYRAWGYRPDWFLLDLLALRAHFINRFGQPRWTIVHGQSMGGHVSIATLEAKDGQILIAQRLAVAVEETTRIAEVGELTLKGLTRPVLAFDVPAPVAGPTDTAGAEPKRATGVPVH
jgi:hypothetical protein